MFSIYLLITAASDNAYQLLAHGRWFSPASSTTNTGRHNIAEILLKVALNTINQINTFNLKSEIRHCRSKHTGISNLVKIKYILDGLVLSGCGLESNDHDVKMFGNIRNIPLFRC